MTIVLNSNTGISTPPVSVLGDTSGSITFAAPAGAGTNTQTLVAATGTLAPLIAGTAQASTSGTSIEFTSIPSWARRITVMLSGVSTNGTNNLQIPRGSGSVTITGYTGASTDGPALTATLFTTGFGIRTASAAANVHGAMTISFINGNTWVATGTFARADGAAFISTAGSLTLGGALDRIRIIGSATGNPADTFDAGTINILYE